MMTGNLSIEQRKWILKQYWKTENAERVRTAWVEAFNTPPPTRLTIYRIRDKFDATGSVATAPKYCIPTFGPSCIRLAVTVSRFETEAFSLSIRSSGKGYSANT